MSLADMWLLLNAVFYLVISGIAAGQKQMLVSYFLFGLGISNVAVAAV